MAKYYLICLDEKSTEGTLLFHKPGGKGYTSSLEEAGLFDRECADNMNRKGRDIALTKAQLKKIPKSKIYTVIDCPWTELVKRKVVLKDG